MEEEEEPAYAIRVLAEQPAAKAAGSRPKYDLATTSTASTSRKMAEASAEDDGEEDDYVAPDSVTRPSGGPAAAKAAPRMANGADSDNEDYDDLDKLDYVNRDVEGRHGEHDYINAAAVIKQRYEEAKQQHDGDADGGAPDYVNAEMFAHGAGLAGADGAKGSTNSGSADSVSDSTKADYENADAIAAHAQAQAAATAKK